MMNYSEQNLTTEENGRKYTESNQLSLNENLQDQSTRPYGARPKNQISNTGIKPNGISGTYTRIIPRKPVHDYEKLYSENMQLKQKICSLEDAFIKIKTRMNITEKQKQVLEKQARTDNYEIFHNRKKSHPNISNKNISSKKIMNDENRKILRDYKDRIVKLEEENKGLKKTVKYTQIQELETENVYLHQEMMRMKEGMEDIVNNTDYEQYQKEIQALNKQLQGEKQSMRAMHTRLKKKDQEIQEIRDKMKHLVNRKTDLQRRFNRQISNYKGELYRVKEREKQILAVEEKRQNRINTQSTTRKPCGVCAQNRKNVDDLEKTVKFNNKIISEKQKQIEKLQKIISDMKKNVPQAKPSDKKQKQQTLKNKSELQKSSENKSDVYEKNKSEVSNKKSNKKKSEQSIQRKSQNKNSNVKEKDQVKDLYDDESHNSEDTQKLLAESNDKVDMLHVNMAEQKKQENKKSEEKQNQNQEDQYNDYDENFEEEVQVKKDQEGSEQEEMLFQKQDRNVTSKQGSRDKNIEKGKKNKGKKGGKDKKGGKQEKILSETVKYRLIGQRYSYADFQRDIKESAATQFGIQDLIDMLTSQPFLLHNEHLEIVLIKCFNKSTFDENDSLTTDQFMDAINPYFNNVKLLSEREQKIVTSQIHKKMRKKAQQIFEAFTQEGKDNKISMKGFMKILSEIGKFNEKQIEQSLSQVSVISHDISQINYPQFMENMLGNEEL